MLTSKRRWVVLGAALSVALPLAVDAPAHAAPAVTQEARAQTGDASAAGSPGSVTSALERARVDRVPTPQLDWRACDLGQCATVPLPLDYDQPYGATIDIAVVKRPANKPDQRIGSLFLNPGGPGGSGTAFVARAGDLLGSDLLDRFDLIGMDPRGTNSSTNTQCFPSVRRFDQVSGTLSSIGFPVDAAQEKTFTRAAAKLARSCSGYGREVASSVSTAQVARDIDVLRRAVGDSQLSYLGFSYGTYLGQVYASLFPDRVRVLALDGMIDPVAWAGTSATASTPMTMRLGSAEATSMATREILRLCEEAGEACGVPNAGALFDQVAARLREAPLELETEEGAFSLTYQMFIGSVVGSLYSPEGAEVIPVLVSLIDQMQAPGVPVSQLSQLSATYRRVSEQSLRKAEAKYPNALEVAPVVMCTDGRNPLLARRWSDLADRADAAAPYAGRYWLWSSVYCAGQHWTAYDEDAYRGSFDQVPANPVLMVGNTYDPATSYDSARAAARVFPRSRLLSSTNWGHTAYGTSACATGHVDSYLVTGSLPAEGTVCDDAPRPFSG